KAPPPSEPDVQISRIRLSGWCVSMRLDEQAMSLTHGEETHLLKVGVWPALIIRPTSESSAALTPPKDRPQTSSHPTVDELECVGVTVLEVSEPASEDGIDVLSDPFKTVSVRPTRSIANLVLELSQTLLARVTTPLLEVVPEEVEPSRRCRVNEFRLFRM